MKRIFTLLPLIFFSLISTAQYSKKVAVFDMEGKVEESIRHIIREEISSAVVNTQGYEVVEREMIDKVLAESQFQVGGLVNDNQISELGKMIGADFVCYGSVEKLSSNYYYISLKMVNVVTAKVVSQKTGSTKDGIDGILPLASKLANLIVGNQGNISGEDVTIVKNNGNETNQNSNNGGKSSGGKTTEDKNVQNGQKILLVIRPKSTDNVADEMGDFLMEKLGGKFIVEKVPTMNGMVTSICGKAANVYQANYVVIIAFSHSGRTWFSKIEVLDVKSRKRISHPKELSVAKNAVSQNEFFKRVLSIVNEFI